MKTNDAETKSAAGRRIGVAEPFSAPSEPRQDGDPLPEDGTRRGRPSRLWLWFVAAFLIQGAAWTAWFVIAAKHPVQEVPLGTAR